MHRWDNTQKNITVKKDRDILLTMADKAEKLCACHLKDSIGELESSVKNICNLLSPVVDVAFRMQQKVGSVNLMEVKSTPSGLW